MPFDVAKAAAKQVPLTVKFDDQELNLEYRPRAITLRRYVELTSLEGPDIHKLCELWIAKWDMQIGGKPVKLNEEALLDVPLDILRDIIAAIREDMLPLPKPATSSGSF